MTDWKKKYDDLAVKYNELRAKYETGSEPEDKTVEMNEEPAETIQAKDMEENEIAPENKD